MMKSRRKTGNGRGEEISDEEKVIKINQIREKNELNQEEGRKG